MNKIAVVIDSGMDLPDEYKKDDVFILPLKVIRDGITFLDGITITPEQVAKELLESDEHEYKTALVSPGDIADFLSLIKEKGYNQVIGLTISSGLSGTNNAFNLAAKTIEGVEVEVIDTLSIGVGAGLHAVEAVDLIEAGLDFKEIVKMLRDNVTKSKVYFYVGSLDFLIKGGRIGKVTGFVGQILHLRPVITCDFEGIYSTVSKVRSQLQGIDKILELITEGFKDCAKVNIGIANCSRGEEMDFIKKEIVKRLSNINKVFTGVISPALTVHAGPELIGITAYPK